MILKTNRYFLCFHLENWLGPGLAIILIGLLLSQSSLIHQKSTPEYLKNTVVLGVNTIYNFLRSPFKEGGWSNPTSSNLKVKYLTLKETGGSKSARWIRIRLVFLQFSSKLLKTFFGESCLISAFTKKCFEKLRMIEIGPRGRWKRSSIFQTSHPSQQSMLSKALSL